MIQRRTFVQTMAAALLVAQGRTHAVNLETARSLKLTLPQSLLGRPDRVIE